MTRKLFDDIRSQQNIFSAWRHVKRSAINSGNPDIRGKASAFEHEHQRHLFRIISQLREGRFKFQPVHGALKDRKKRSAQGKAPRPIAIATLEDRVVQRAILQVLQPRVLRDPKDPNSREDTKYDPRLCRINDVNRSKYGVGGLIYPYGGVRPAIEKIRESIDKGAKYFYQSDIKSFFTKIPTNIVIYFINSETKDDCLVEIFSKALDVRLNNTDDLNGYHDLFPRNGIGVAQGASLSAFAGNVLLFEMDHALNSMGVTSIRYIDDILMVAAKEADLNQAINHAESTLSTFGFGLYSATDGSGKANRGECSSAISFLGCTIQPNRCVPSAEAIKSMKAGIVEALSTSKAAIKQAVHFDRRIDPKHSQSQTLSMLGKKIYGWQKSFAFCTDRQPFQHLDDFVCSQINEYEAFVRRMLQRSSSRVQMQIYGIPSTRDMFEASRSNA